MMAYTPSGKISIIKYENIDLKVAQVIPKFEETHWS